MQFLECRARNEVGEIGFRYTNRCSYNGEDLATLAQITMAYAMDGRPEFETEVILDDNRVFSYFDGLPNDYIFTVTVAGNSSIEIFGVSEGSSEYETETKGVPLDLATQDGMIRALKELNSHWVSNNHINIFVITEQSLFDRLCKLKPFANEFLILI